MTNEAVIVELHGSPSGRPVRYNVGNTMAVEKGTLMWIRDDIISGSNITGRDFVGEGNAFAGIAASEKVASDGSTTLGLWTAGIFDMITGKAVSAGTLMAISGGNFIRPALALDILSGAVVGKSLEDGSANEVIKVLVGAGY